MLVDGVLGWKLKVGLGAPAVVVAGGMLVPELVDVEPRLVNSPPPLVGFAPNSPPLAGAEVEGVELGGAGLNSPLVGVDVEGVELGAAVLNSPPLAGVEVGGFVPKSPPEAGAVDPNRVLPAGFVVGLFAGGGPAGVVEFPKLNGGFAGVLVPAALFPAVFPNILGGAVLFRLPNIDPEAGAEDVLFAGGFEVAFSSFFPRLPKLKVGAAVPAFPNRLGVDVPEVVGGLAPNIPPAGVFPVLLPKRPGVEAPEVGFEAVFPPPNIPPPVFAPPPNRFEVAGVLPPLPNSPPGLDVAVAVGAWPNGADVPGVVVLPLPKRPLELV